MARKAWNREEHARIVDEWLALPTPRPSLYSFLKERKYSVSQRSIQNELERRGLNRITGEPEQTPKEPETPKETEVEDVKEPASSGVIATTVAKVEPVPEPPQEEPEKSVGEKPAPEKPAPTKDEEPEGEGRGSMVGFLALGTVAVAVAGLVVVMSKKGRSVQNVGTVEPVGGPDHRPNTEPAGGYGRGLQLRTIDDYR